MSFPPQIAGIKNTDAEMRDAVLNDATKFAGASIAIIRAYVDCLPDSLGDLVEKNLAAILSDETAFKGADIATIMDKVESMPFWSDVEDKITITSTAADLDFPDVVVSGLPSGITITRVYAVLFARAIKDTSGSDNAINGVNKRIRIKLSTGSWGTDDIIAFTFDDNQLYCVASTKENGFVMVGTHDLDSVVTADGTYNFRSEQTNRGDALVVDGDSLELYDVQIGLIVEFER